jgi:hypothetical protein
VRRSFSLNKQSLKLLFPYMHVSGNLWLSGTQNVRAITGFQFNFLGGGGRAVAQAVSRRSFKVVAWVQS